MPRNTNHPVDSPEITIRMKHGIHTIFMFVGLDDSFSKITDELLTILRDLYPDGLTTSIHPPKQTSVPASNTEVRVVYGLPKNLSNLSLGWERFDVKETDRPFDRSELRNNCSVAFTLIGAGERDENAQFEVEIPTLEDGFASASSK
ncbi:hypothetical protein QBC46DRAFT_296657 [Diplogelasinospora grovesii]|uniref:Uncharacterized protein n=1 Tax=Diplogelasinospora grovesii TaxID=303347 RepID=A0AAN6N2H4_9PEZI|nr:hypothetical protein QBC46DRAFT_296657 [Diplogelasinospora grovesii]